MSASSILVLYLILRALQHSIESMLSRMNRQYLLNRDNQKRAQSALAISDDNLQKTVRYFLDKFRFVRITGWLDLVVLGVFLLSGGLGFVEKAALDLNQGPIVTGLVFFLFLALLTSLLSLPQDYYFVFTIEERHGFNKQTRRTFWIDKLKGFLLASVLGGLVLAATQGVILLAGAYWWVFAWLTLFGFTLIGSWLYPTLLAPLFNKFTPLETSTLRSRIEELAHQLGFETNGIFVMDASRRTAHGNAYFTGMFGKKRIVLFDTLLESLGEGETVAVMAHELGHFKLHHIRKSLLRAFFLTGLIFFALSRLIASDAVFEAFRLTPDTPYGKLLLLSLFMPPLNLLLQPILNGFSRAAEYEADRFAVTQVGGAAELRSALLKLREKSQGLPLHHPLYSRVYLSHPSLLERLRAMEG